MQGKKGGREGEKELTFGLAVAREIELPRGVELRQEVEDIVAGARRG